MDTKDSTIKIFMVREGDNDMSKGIQRVYKEHFPELGESNDPCTILERESKIKTAEGYVTRKKKIVDKARNIGGPMACHAPTVRHRE